MRIVSSFALTAVVTFSPWLRAENVAPLIVERGPGAERCPDAETIGARVEQIRGRPAVGLASPYRVTFTRREEGFLATIRTDATAGVRTLEHDGASCSPLGHAVSLTLALLLDSSIEPKKVEVPPVPAPTAVATVTPPSPSSPPSREATLSLGAAALAGVLRPVLPAFSGEAGVSFAPLRASAGAIWAWPQTLSLGPGTVHERLLAGFARVCVATWQKSGLRLDACSGALVGAVTAEAEDFTRNEHRTRAWIALPFEAALAGWTAPVGWEVSLAGLVPLRRPDFTIDGIGTAYTSPALGGMLSLRMIGIVPW